LPSSGLFDPIFAPEPLWEAVSDRAWLQAMLDAEAALATALARVGVIPGEAAAAIKAGCRAELFDIDELGREARAAGNPVVPLVRALPQAVPGDAARYLHWGATSQDILDTAAMLIARRALELIDAELARVAAASARLAEDHRTTLMPARTLMQQALPTTFGLKVAGWLSAVGQAREGLDLCDLAAQLGGAAGTLAAFGDRGIEVLAEFAEELDLSQPDVPWHSDRTRVGQLGAALAVAAGAMGKIGLDVVLLSQTEVGEVSEAAPGGSSAMPHKRNPTGSVRARACAQRVHALATGLTVVGAHEHERAAGAWHAEWQPLGEALALTGGAAAAIAEVLEGLDVHAERMRANIDLTGGALLGEHVVMILAERVGRPEARRLVDEASDPRELLTPEDAERALDPAAYLGATQALIDRALERYAP
jgi:3-carboxy-cis,cis-muconate cycloisomerase